MKSITIKNIEPALYQALKTKAVKSNCSIEALVKQLLEQQLKIGNSNLPQRAITELFGIWSKEEATEFEKATQVFNEIDEEE